MAQDPPGVVVFGTGFGCFTHVRALRSAGFDLRAVVGRDPDKTRRRARIFEVPKALVSVDEALALPGVQAVTIATPPHTHAEIAHKAIAAGKHLICEKPFARDIAEGESLCSAAERAGVVALVGTEFRFDAGQATLARCIASGAIGEPRLATVLLHVGVLADPDAELPDWWADAGQGGGWLGAHGSQVIDQIRFTLGDFAAVSASLTHVGGREMSADDGFIVQFRLDGGCVGTMQSTCADRSPPMIETRVAGTEGSAWIRGLGSEVYVADADGTRRIPVDDDLQGGEVSPPPEGALETDYERMIGLGLDIPSYTRLASCFRALMEGRALPSRSVPAGFPDGLAALRVLEAARRSAAETRWVEVGTIR
ncbi:MAG: Gfo/Idh/MocA family oxidoreductase [Deltaproteobacteria bacterium]|nr:Gfo/Idh/MocA family oxidoreductase [Deltaproteobacteria bacterium]MBW2417228.1 Gfo/Idh/MocA family oxidoreductase [Deltaproteobacteria bacterium]